MRYENKNTVINILGGYKEIGGNLVIVEYKDKEIVLDIGYSLKKFKSLYEWPTRMPKGIDELIRVGLAPSIRGLYTRWEKNGLEPDYKYGKDSNIQAIFISHSHYDHISLLPQVNRNIEIYIGGSSKAILDKRIELGRTYRYNNYKGLKLYTFKSFDEINVDVFRVIPIHVDHSIPGAYGFIIETPDTVIVYTGDYRLHGQEKSLTEDFINNIKKFDVDVLITEGTRVHDIEDIRERDVYIRLSRIFQKNNKPIFIESSYLDIDRIKSIFNASNDSGKRILITSKHFIYIYSLGLYDNRLRPNINKDLLTVLFPKKKSSLIKKFYETLSSNGYNVIDEDEILLNNDTVYMDFNEYIQKLIKTKVPPGSLAIFSNSEPFDEESYIDFKKVINWLNIFCIPSYRIHSSGHASPLDIKRLVDETKPKDIMVIHSEYPDTLKKFLEY